MVRLRKEGTSSSSAAVGLAVHYEYDAYGKILSTTNHISSGENISLFNPIKYKGYYYEDNIGLYRLDSRFYDPVIARFLNADDLSLITETPTSLSDKNLYNYCDNNPVMRKDSDGEFWHIAAGAAVGAVISGSIEVACQIIESGKVTDWGNVAKSAAGGALTGALAASGVGVAGQMAGNARSNALVEGWKNGAQSGKDIVYAGVVGAIAGKAGGAGVGKSLKGISLSPVKRAFNEVKHSKKLKSGAKEFKKGWRYVKKHAKHLFKSGKRNYWYRGKYGIAVNACYNSGSSYRKR